MTVEAHRSWSLWFFWSTSLWLDKEEIVFLFPFLWNLHRSGKVAVCWFTNYSDLSMPLLHLIKSPYWLFWICLGSVQRKIWRYNTHEKHVSRDSLLDRVIFLDEQCLFLRHFFPFWCCSFILLNFSFCFLHDSPRCTQSIYSISSAIK